MANTQTKKGISKKSSVKAFKGNNQSKTKKSTESKKSNSKKTDKKNL